MKRLHILLTVVILQLAAFVSCSKDESISGGTPGPAPEIEMQTTACNFITAGGENKILFTAKSDWTAEVINSRADGWLSIYPASGPAGDAEITVTTIANDTPDDRTASIVIKSGATTKTIPVSQKQKDALTVTSSRFEVPAAGDEVIVEVKANIDFEYMVEESASDWISYAATRAMETSTLVFNVSENIDTEKREGRIYINSGEFNETITVYQSGSEPAIVISQNEYVVLSGGETIAVDVVSNVDVSVELPADADWIVENTTRAVSTNTYRFDISPNEDYEQRSAEIKFTNSENGLSESVCVVQAQKDALIAAKERYEVGNDGGEIKIDVSHNTGFDVEISDNWITMVTSRAFVTETLTFYVSQNGGDSREGTIVFKSKDGALSQTVTVAQTGLNDAREQERQALVAIYNALGGDNWNDNTNWCSDKPLSEWYGVEVDNSGLVMSLNLANNNLVGKIPPEIRYLKNMMFVNMSRNGITGIPDEIGEISIYELALTNNSITGLPEDMGVFNNIKLLSLGNNPLNCEIPESIGALTDVSNLSMGSCGLYGAIPESIGSMSNLRVLDLSENELTGAIPESMGNLSNLERLLLIDNHLSGKVPESLMKLEKCWPYWWFYILTQSGTGFSREGVVIPAPKFSAPTIDGGTLDYSVYAKNEYTILYNYFDWCPYSEQFTPTLMELYEGYRSKGVEVIAFSGEGSVDYHRAYEARFGTSWPYILLEDGNSTIFNSFVAFSPGVYVVDRNGDVVFDGIFDSYNNLDTFLREHLGYPDSDGYFSSDYSQDGTFKVLQTASEGDGINIVLMGDGYSDRQIADGTYRADMEFAYNNLFTEEPYKSFSHLFNVSYVNVVSATEGYGQYLSALEGYFGEGTAVGGNDSKAFGYALNVLTEEQMDEAMIIVVMNSNEYAGTCYMYYPTVMGSDWGSGVSVSYFPKGGNETVFAQLLHHEACGHGFSKLADEYAYEEYGQIPSSEVSSAMSLQDKWGWYKNIDFTSDPEAVRWSHFLSDRRYAYDGLGVYEGGYTYWTGVWRPTPNSIMNENTGGFNAPSREAIYYRIHKLAYGEEWKYDYEDFVAYDELNRNVAGMAAEKVGPYRRMEPTHPPVVVKKTWRDAMQ